MLLSVVSLRYANALYDLVLGTDVENKVGEEIGALSEIFREGDVKEFIESPLVSPSLREKALAKATEGMNLSEQTVNFVLTLAKKNRLRLLPEIVEAYREKRDRAHGVLRGKVESAVALSVEEREEIKTLVERAIKKKVILSYEENPKVLGGLTAKVGSFVFDDTLTFHLKKMKEDLKRRTH